MRILMTVVYNSVCIYDFQLLKKVFLCSFALKPYQSNITWQKNIANKKVAAGQY